MLNGNRKAGIPPIAKAGAQFVKFAGHHFEELKPMKTCQHCGASNSNYRRFCDSCGRGLLPASDLADAASPRVARPGDEETQRARFPPNEDPTLRRPSSQDPTLRAKPRSPQAVGQARSNFKQPASSAASDRQADIMFVLDCTESMAGELNAIRDAITAFTAVMHTAGVTVRVGLIEFRDRLINEEHRALDFAGQPFTTEAELFRHQVARLTAWGGGDPPESSLDALMLALRQPFHPTADKVIVLITDAPPHLPDWETQSLAEVKAEMERVGLHQLYLIIRLDDPESRVYLELLTAIRARRARGAFDLGQGDDFRARAAHFQQTLLNLGQTISQSTRWQ